MMRSIPSQGPVGSLNPPEFYGNSRYEDSVLSQDEIKSLGAELGRMPRPLTSREQIWWRWSQGLPPLPQKERQVERKVEPQVQPERRPEPRPERRPERKESALNPPEFYRNSMYDDSGLSEGELTELYNELVKMPRTLTEKEKQWIRWYRREREFAAPGKR